MKGDLNLKISKKSALLIAGVISFFAMADYVSVVTSDSVSYISEVPQEEKMIVGSVVFRMDDKNPEDIYGGTWNLLAGDATIGLGDGTSQTGVITGDNEPLIPLVAHDHSFSGDALPPHSHSYSRTRIANVNDHSASQGHWLQANYTTNTSSVSAGTPTGAISKNGIENATLNVRGAVLTINVWERTN